MDWNNILKSSEPKFIRCELQNWDPTVLCVVLKSLFMHSQPLKIKEPMNDWEIYPPCFQLEVGITEKEMPAVR